MPELAKRFNNSYPHLENHIIDASRHYTRLTCRLEYYILVSRYGYKAGRRFYKSFIWHLTRMRRLNRGLHERFVDPTRHFVPAPTPYPAIEIFCEKDSIRSYIADLAARYRLSIQVLRGFGSLSCYRVALQRAAKKGVKRILYLGDFDPSGILIDQVAEKEMGLEFKRIALTWEQILRYRPPSIPVNMRDSRARDYIARHGDRAWEIESIRPRTLLRIVEEKLRENVPLEYLVEAEARERAARIARPLAERLRKMMERDVSIMLEEGKLGEEIRTRLASKYGLRLRRQRQ